MTAPHCPLSKSPIVVIVPILAMAESRGDRELIVDVSRDLVATVAPEEMVLFRPMSTAYFDAPDRLAQPPRDDMLGFGAGDAVVALTPVALSVMGAVLTYLRHEVAEATGKEVTQIIDERVRAMFRRFHRGDQTAAPASGAAPAPGLSREQLAEVSRLAFEHARTMHLSEVRARLLADAVVGSLVLQT